MRCGNIFQARGLIPDPNSDRVCQEFFYPLFNSFTLQADRGFATSRLRSDEDGTILAHNILHGFDWNIEKGGNAPRAPDEMRDFYPPQASVEHL